MKLENCEQREGKCWLVGEEIGPRIEGAEMFVA